MRSKYCGRREKTDLLFWVGGTEGSTKHFNTKERSNIQAAQENQGPHELRGLRVGGMQG